MKNNLKEIQDLMLKQMHRLDESTVKGEIQLEIGRSGALSSNAQAYLKSLATSIKVKEMAKKDIDEETKIMQEIGAWE